MNRVPQIRIDSHESESIHLTLQILGNPEILTVVEVAEISGVKEEVCSEEIEEASPSSAERKWCVEVEPSSPVCVSTQEVTWTGRQVIIEKQIEFLILESMFLKCKQKSPSLCGPMQYMPNPLTLVGPPR